MQTAYYRRSGRIAPTAPLWLVLLGAPLAALIGGIYALVIHVNPFVKLSFVAAVGFGIFVSAAADAAQRAGKSRSLLFDLLGTAILALFALWFSWLAWIALTFANGAFVASHLALTGPGEWCDFLAWLAHNYHETISRYAGSGTPSSAATPAELFEQWAGEALLVVGTAMLGTLANRKDRIFSEKTHRWATRSMKCEATGPRGAPKDIRAALEASDYSLLECLEPHNAGQAPSGDASWQGFEVTLQTDPDDTGLCVLQLDAFTIRLNTKGKVRRDRETVVENLLLPFNVYTRLVGRLNNVPLASP